MCGGDLPEVLEELLKGLKTQEDLAGLNGVLKAIRIALVIREAFHGADVKLIW